MRLLSRQRKLPQYFIRKFKLGKVTWFVRADIIDYNLAFARKAHAELYRQLLKVSSAQIKARVERVQVDDHTGLHITYPIPEEDL